MKLKYDFNDLSIGTAINPDTGYIAWALLVRKENHDWKTYYVSESYTSEGLDEVIEFAKAWHPEANVFFGGHYKKAAEL